MLLKDTFFSIEDYSLDSDNHKIRSRIKFNKNHAVFSGHFPDVPVVPGVCLVQIIKEILESIFHFKLFMNNASSIKFIKMVSPVDNESVIYSIDYKISGAEINLDCNVNYSSDIHLKFRGIFGIIS